ncbi:MAG: protein kinase [Chloroflexi bacterium]|nr:protein kinase [Chloroflexota bacterium]
MVETGRVIHRRYLLQRIIKQEHTCTIYQALDQVLQRTVSVKVIPAAHASAYRAAIRLTSQFSHPNIVGTYDLIVEPETLYVVQEYVDGDEFAVLLQTQLPALQIVDIGVQVCSALVYAGSASRKVCHGNLTPNAIMRDRRGLIRVNNFALPSDLAYFTNWSRIGGVHADGIVSDRELAWGHASEGRRADDTRALGLLLYQLLAGRTPGVSSVEPPSDGRLHFLRNVPAQLCEIVARAVVRQHPQHISTAETLSSELKALTETLEPPSSLAIGGVYQPEDPTKSKSLLGIGRLATAPTVREMQTDSVLLRPPSDIASQQAAAKPFAAAPTVADFDFKLATADQSNYPEREAQAPSQRLSLPMLLLIGLIVFALFFAVGYFVANILPH